MPTFEPLALLLAERKPLRVLDPTPGGTKLAPKLHELRALFRAKATLTAKLTKPDDLSLEPFDAHARRRDDGRRGCAPPALRLEHRRVPRIGEHASERVPTSLDEVRVRPEARANVTEAVRARR